MTTAEKADLRGDIQRASESDADRDAAAGILRRPFRILQEPVRLPALRHGVHCPCRDCYLRQKP